MQPETIMISLLILMLCILAFVIVFLVKAKLSRSILIAICVAAVIAIALIGLFLHENKNINIKDFNTFSIDDLSYSNKMIEALLETQVDDIDYALTSADDFENRIVIGTFDLHFRNNSFSNLQFTIVLSESGGPFEKNYQINYMGQVFTAPKTLALSETFYDNTLSLRELKNAIEILSKSDVIHAVSASAPNSVNVMFNGHINTLPEANDLSNIYTIQDENVIPLSHAAPQENNGYYVFSIVSDIAYIQILCPQ